MKNLVLVFVVLFSPLTFAANDSAKTLMCFNQYDYKQHEKPLYSVSVVINNGEKGEITISRNGVVVLKEEAASFSEETLVTAESTNSALIVDYEDDSSGSVRFCEGDKLVDVGFDYKECSYASSDWSRTILNPYVKVLPCEKKPKK